MLDLNLGIMLIEAGIFLITLVLLKKWLFDPLVKFMDEREAKLKAELEMISKNTKESEMYKEKIEEILNNARAQAKEIVAKAKEEALNEAQKVKLEKEKELEKAKEELREMLEKEKEDILRELLAEKDEIKALVENKIRNAA